MRAGRLWWAAPLALVGAAYATSVGFAFVSDAEFLIRDNTYAKDLSGWWDALTHDYFWSSSGNSIPYWRPVTKLSWVLEWQLFGDWPGGYHLVGVAWLLVGVAGIMLLARELGLAPAWAAAVGVMYGLHPAMIEAVCLIMARSDVVAATAAVWAVFTWSRWRRDGGWRWGLAHVASLAIALGSKEVAVILAPLLTLWLALAREDAARGRRRWLAIAPVWGAAIVYLVLRSIVLRAHGAPALILDPYRIAVGGAAYLQGLLPLRLGTGVRNIPLAEARATGSLVGAALTLSAAVGAFAWTVRVRWAVGSAMLLWIGGALAPVLLVEQLSVPGASGKLPLADRWLVHAVAASSLLAALALARVATRRVALAAGGAVAVWALASVLVSPQSHGYYANAASMLALEQQWFEDTPEKYRTVDDYCRQGQRAVVESLRNRDFDGAIAITSSMAPPCRARPINRLNLLAALVDSDRLEEALPVAEGLLEKPPFDRRHELVMFELTGVTLAAAGRARRARELLADAERLGSRSCRLSFYLARAEAGAGRPAAAAERLEKTAACRQASGRSVDPAMWVLAARQWHKAKKPADARRALERALAAPELAPAQRQAAEALLATLD